MFLSLQKPLAVVAIAAALCAGGVLCLDAVAYLVALGSGHSCCQKPEQSPDSQTRAGVTCIERAVEIQDHGTPDPLAVAGASQVTPVTPMPAVYSDARQFVTGYSPPGTAALHHILLI